MLGHSTPTWRELFCSVCGAQSSRVLVFTFLKENKKKKKPLHQKLFPSLATTLDIYHKGQRKQAPRFLLLLLLTLLLLLFLRQDHRAQADYVVNDDFELLILQLHLSKCWDYKNEPPDWVFTALGMESRHSYMAGKYSPNWAVAWTLWLFIDPFCSLLEAWKWEQLNVSLQSAVGDSVF